MGDLDDSAAWAWWTNLSADRRIRIHFWLAERKHERQELPGQLAMDIEGDAMNDHDEDHEESLGKDGPTPADSQEGEQSMRIVEARPIGGVS